jgi:hypothetical protein
MIGIAPSDPPHTQTAQARWACGKFVPTNIDFFKPDKYGRKEETWTDVHFWQYPQLVQWRQL